MKKLLSFLKAYKKQLIIGPSFKLLEAILELLIPTLMVYVIDIGVQTRNKEYIFKLGGLMLLIAAIGLISALICQYSASIASQGFGTDVRNALFKHITGLSSEEIDKIGTSAYINRITNDVNVLQSAVAMLIRLVIRAPFITIGSIIMAMLLNFKLSLIIIATLPLLVLVIYLIMKKTIPIYRQVLKHLDSMTLILRENLSGVRVIRAFSTRESEKERFQKANSEFAKGSIKVGRISTLLNPATTIIMNFAIILILYFSGISINKGNMTQGEIIAFINYISYMVTAIIVTANLVILFTRAWASAGRVIEVFNQTASIQDGLSEIESKETEYSVEFNDVSFSYGKNRSNVLSNISFNIKKGESLGIIGGTGSGKTTLINLIPRLYDVNHGHVYVMGNDVRNCILNELRSKIAAVSQCAVLFSGTVIDNIRQGNKDACYEDAVSAAENAGAKDFITKKTEGFNHIIERGGVNLSGGQKQRLSIARALARKPEILILDDSLSALDYATESFVMKNIWDYENMTKIIVSQRINSVSKCDNILVLEDGVVAGYGKHDTLYKESNVYREICDSQLN